MRKDYNWDAQSTEEQLFRRIGRPEIGSDWLAFQKEQALKPAIQKLADMFRARSIKAMVDPHLTLSDKVKVSVARQTAVRTVEVLIKNAGLSQNDVEIFVGTDKIPTKQTQIEEAPIKQVVSGSAGYRASALREAAKDKVQSSAEVELLFDDRVCISAVRRKNVHSKLMELAQQHGFPPSKVEFRWKTIRW